MYFCSQEELFDSNCTQIAEIRNVAKSLPPLRWNRYKSLILSYSADFSVFFDEKHYLCAMKEIIETIPRIELALIIIGVFVLISSIIFGYAMIHEYRMYLENHWKARYSFRDFIKRERFYIFLLLASIFIFLTNLLYFLEWVSVRMDELALWWIPVL